MQPQNPHGKKLSPEDTRHVFRKLWKSLWQGQPQESVKSEGGHGIRETSLRLHTRAIGLLKPKIFNQRTFVSGFMTRQVDGSKQSKEWDEGAFCPVITHSLLCYHCVEVYCALNLVSLCDCMNSVVATIENCIYSRLSELNGETDLWLAIALTFVLHLLVYFAAIKCLLPFYNETVSLLWAVDFN